MSGALVKGVRMSGATDGPMLPNGDVRVVCVTLELQVKQVEVLWQSQRSRLGDVAILA